MNTKLGDAKAKRIRDSKKIDTIPCFYKGEDTEIMREYNVKKLWQRHMTNDNNALFRPLPLEMPMIPM